MLENLADTWKNKCHKVQKDFRKSIPFISGEENKVSMNNRIQIDQPAPDFTLADLHGHKIRLTDFNNKSNVLLVFNRGFV